VSSGGRLSHATTNHDAGFTVAVSLADAPPRSPAMSRSASHGRQGGEPTPSERTRSRPNVVGAVSAAATATNTNVNGERVRALSSPSSELVFDERIALAIADVDSVS